MKNLMRIGLALALALAGATSLGLTTEAAAAGGWETRSSGTTQNLYAVWWSPSGPGGGIGYAVGAAGTILQTTDGFFWTPITNAGTTADLYAVTVRQMFNPNPDPETPPTPPEIWIAGANGTIIFSGNGGASWCSETSGTTSRLTGIWAPQFPQESSQPTQQMFVSSLGGTILTSNSPETCGTTWTDDNSGTTSDLYGLRDFLAVGAGGTIDRRGGQAWSPSGDVSGTTQTLFAVSGFRSDNVFPAQPGPDTACSQWTVGAGGTVLRKMQSSSSEQPGCGVEGDWTPQTSGTALDLHGVDFPNDLVNGWAVGDKGTILNTTDGQTWAAQTSGTCSDLRGVMMGNEAQPQAAPHFVGLAVGTNGTILRFDQQAGAAPAVTCASPTAAAAPAAPAAPAAAATPLLPSAGAGSRPAGPFLPLLALAGALGLTLSRRVRMHSVEDSLT